MENIGIIGGLLIILTVIQTVHVPIILEQEIPIVTALMVIFNAWDML